MILIMQDLQILHLEIQLIYIFPCEEWGPGQIK